VRADNGYHVWSETFDRKLDDIFKVQDEIALAVVTALKASLLQQALDRSTITARPGVYTLYLQGVSSWNRGTAEDFHKAVDYFKRALALDPNYVPALGVLGQVLVDEFIYSGNLAAMGAVSAQVHDAAQKAIALEPKSSDGHLAMARALQEFDWRWETAEAEYKSAMHLDPKNAEAFGMASHLASLLDHHDEAVRLAGNATKIDPLNSFTHLYLGWAQSSRGNLAEAEAAYRKSLELNPAADMVRGALGSLLLRKGDATAALAEIDQEPDEMTRRGLRPLALDALGRRTDADREIAALEQNSSDHPYLLAAIYAWRNDSNRAFALLDLAYQQHDRSLPYLKTDDRFRNLARDPRYKALLRKMNLPE
jgi:tetratricopeptide (TPR) repeat protein